MARDEGARRRAGSELVGGPLGIRGHGEYSSMQAVDIDEDAVQWTHDASVAWLTLMRCGVLLGVRLVLLENGRVGIAEGDP